MASEPEKAPSIDETLKTATAVVTTLGTVVQDLRGEVTTLTSYGRHNRHLIKVIGASVLLDILLSVGLGYGLHQSRSAEMKATTARDIITATQVSGCQFGNTTRAAEHRLWDELLGTVVRPRPDETLEEKSARLDATARVKDLVNEAYGQRDCAVAPK